MQVSLGDEVFWVNEPESFRLTKSFSVPRMRHASQKLGLEKSSTFGYSYRAFNLDLKGFKKLIFSTTYDNETLRFCTTDKFYLCIQSVKTHTLFFRHMSTNGIFYIPFKSVSNRQSLNLVTKGK